MPSDINAAMSSLFCTKAIQILAIDEKTQQRTDERADRARFAGLGRERIAKTDEGVDAGGRLAERRQHSKHASLQSDVMGKRRFHFTMHTAQRERLLKRSRPETGCRARTGSGAR